MHGVTPQQLDVLLDKLGNDDAFRELFTRSPADALKQIGATPDHARCIAQIRNLASKEAIRTTRAVLQQQLTSKLDQIVPGLDAE